MQIRAASRKPVTSPVISPGVKMKSMPLMTLSAFFSGNKIT